jgi:transposase
VPVIKNADISSLSKDELIVRVLQLEHQVSMFQKIIFGPKQERFIPTEVAKNQLALDIQVEATAEVEVKEVAVKEHKRVEVKKKPKAHPGRHPLPANLRREEIILEPSEDVSGCVCIGEEVTEVLEVTPSEFYVKRYIRPKYARKCEEGVAIAQLPNRVINKGIAGSSVLAMLIINKFVDHLPIHRQIAIFKRIGVELNYNTVLEWGNESLNVLLPLYERLKKHSCGRNRNEGVG